MNKSDKKQFKLILGAGNKDLDEISKIVKVYSLAGADVVDMNPSADVLDKVIVASESKMQYCVSYTVSGDIHSQKAVIYNSKCNKCGKCVQICPENAIKFCNDLVILDEKKCIGCEKCKCSAITYSSDAAQNNWKNFKQLVKTYPIKIVELHISSKNREEILQKWKYVLDNFDGYYSICINRTFYSNEQLIKMLDEMISMTDKDKVIIQADGAPMTGGENDFKSTLQAVACADLVSKLGVKIFISGGTNAKTVELANLCELEYEGISVGSYARKIIKNKHFDEALLIAKKLVETVKNG